MRASAYQGTAHAGSLTRSCHCAHCTHAAAGLPCRWGMYKALFAVEASQGYTLTALVCGTIAGCGGGVL